MKIEDLKDGKLITLSKAFDTRPKILNFIYFILFSAAIFGFGNMVGQDALQNLGPFLFVIIPGSIYLFAGYRFLNKALQTEKLFISKELIKIYRKGILSNEEHTYKVELIYELKHNDKPEYSRHTLAGDTFDYLGFQTEQTLINEMHGDNRISFVYNGKIITFGENIFSWDFEELEILIYKITTIDLRRKENIEKNFI